MSTESQVIRSTLSKLDGTYSPWGEATNKAAAHQLGLDESHTIVMMATEVDYLENAQAIAAELKDIGVCYVQDVIDIIEEKIIHIQLPRGMLLVAMAPHGKDEPRTYGLVSVAPSTGDSKP